MSAYSSMPRRSFLKTLASLCALAGLSGTVHLLSRLGRPPAAEPLALSLAHFFPHDQSAKIVGLEYLRGAPHEASASVLVDLICSSDPERRGQLAQADARKRRELLRAQQRQDFEQGRIVRVQGWILSETEARLCALAALA